MQQSEQKALLEKIDRFIDENEKALVKDIATLVSVRSVQGSPVPGAPFGEAPRQALNMALGIAKRLGLSVNDGEGYVGWAALAGKEPAHIATITHLDVVSEGEGWEGDPYILRQQDGWLLGRGVCDDKGPGVLCLYAAAFFARQQIPLRYGLRVLLGCNEESGMQDVAYYLAHNAEPVFCFSPDADFPVCNGEKGVLTGDFVSAPLHGNLVEFHGGDASNVIPDTATCLVKGDASALRGTARVQLQAEGEFVRLTATGICGHAARPEGSINAIGLLVTYLLHNGLCIPEEEMYLALLHKLHAASDGSGLHIACRDEVFGALTCIGGMLSFREGRLHQNVNIRYPACTSGETLGAALQTAAAEFGAAFCINMIEEPFYIPPTSAPIRTLIRAYNEVTGLAAEPFTMGGGTYARHFKHAVSFGPEMPGEVKPAFVGLVHGANEGISLSSLRQALKIYIYTLCLLQEVDF